MFSFEIKITLPRKQIAWFITPKGTPRCGGCTVAQTHITTNKKFSHISHFCRTEGVTQHNRQPTTAMSGSTLTPTLSQKVRNLNQWVKVRESSLPYRQFGWICLVFFSAALAAVTAQCSVLTGWVGVVSRLNNFQWLPISRQILQLNFANHQHLGESAQRQHIVPCARIVKRTRGCSTLFPRRFDKRSVLRACDTNAAAFLDYIIYMIL